VITPSGRARGAQGQVDGAGQVDLGDGLVERPALGGEEAVARVGRAVRAVGAQHAVRDADQQERDDEQAEADFE
jgi:hypothetical protein